LNRKLTQISDGFVMCALEVCCLSIVPRPRFLGVLLNLGAQGGTRSIDFVRVLLPLFVRRLCCVRMAGLAREDKFFPHQS
jgi:hypothetical protein